MEKASGVETNSVWDEIEVHEHLSITQSIAAIETKMAKATLCVPLYFAREISNIFPAKQHIIGVPQTQYVDGAVVDLDY